jgi:hypothetical protein
MGAFRLPSAADLPVTAKFRNWQFPLHGHSEGTEALAVIPVEAHCRLQKAVALAAFARLESLDPGRVEHVHIGSDARVQ